MSARLLLALFLLILTSAAQAQDIEPTWLEVADVALRLRNGPSSDEDIITQMTPREAVVLLERGEAWSHIRRQDGTSGWAHNDYLLPWDERNRPDTLRRVGDRRLFRVHDEVSRRHVIVNAELRAVSDHMYVYAQARRPEDRLPYDAFLRMTGELFDERIYRQTLDLWGIEDPPHIEGDERVVMLLTVGFDDGGPGHIEANYHARSDMPGEVNPGARATGFISINFSRPDSLGARDADFFLSLPAHEFRHMLHHHVGGNQALWVDEGLAKFTEVSLGYWDGDASSFLSRPRSRLNDFNYSPFAYGSALLFTAYIHDRLGLEALRNYAGRPERGLAALDALLAEREAGIDADDFFADWVLANYLLDTRREDGRYGYPSLGRLGLLSAAARSHVRRLPAALRDATPPYTADYYELPPPDSGDPARLLLDFRLNAAPPQDAWLQLVQVLPESIDVQRYRASEYRGQVIRASLTDRPERVFLAISPFTPSARQRSRAVGYSLALREQGAIASDRAQVTTTLRVRSAAEIGDNILGNLQRCSHVQVLQRGEAWSQVLGADGLTGWSHNDYLALPGGEGAGRTAASCAALTRAAHDGNLGEVRRLLANGAPVNGADAFGRTALHEAAFWGHDDVLARLLRAGADVHAQDAVGRTALDDALQTGNVSSLLLLGQAGADLDLSGPASLPLMIEAAAQGNTSLLELVLAEGHHINWRDANGRTALAAAASNGRNAALGQLISLGADPHWSDADGRSAMLLAAANGHDGALALLLDAGVDVNRQDREGHTALTLAAQNGHANALAWLLLSADVEVGHQAGPRDRNALQLAAAAGHDDVVALLLLANADIDTMDASGQTALQLARAAEHGDVEELLHFATATEVRGRSQTSPDSSTRVNGESLRAAVRAVNLQEIERLIEAGAGLNEADDEGMTALKLASLAGERTVVLMLLRAGALTDTTGNEFHHDHTALYHAIRGRNDDISAMLLLAGARPSRQWRTTALHWAAEFGRADVARLLLNIRGWQRVPVDARYYGKTPLFEAVRTGRGEIVDLLLAAGADPNAPDQEFNVPLVFAVWWEHEEIVKQLLAAGADPNGDSRSSLSPLEQCTFVGNAAITKLLLEAGAEY
ncbi:MAG: ankyrin repeat domain-containing protein [Anaerolineaceae bacterium]|nr:ankyrin repeat domain-containing protein [Anaerolineaceae bacterium]